MGLELLDLVNISSIQESFINNINQFIIDSIHIQFPYLDVNIHKKDDMYYVTITDKEIYYSEKYLNLVYFLQIKYLYQIPHIPYFFIFDYNYEVGL